MAPQADQVLAHVDWLLDYGLGTSAHELLGDRRGFEANQRRLRAGTAELLTRIYMMTTSPDGARAWALPATVQLVVPPHRDVEGRVFEALEDASDCVRELLGATVLPRHSLYLEAERHTRLEGNSLGLAAALAYVWQLSGQTRAALSRPVFATGRVLAGGKLGGVESVSAKVSATLAFLDTRPGYVLVPLDSPPFSDPRVIPCATVADAIEQVMGTRQPALDVRFVHVDRWLEDVDRKPSPEAVAELASVDLSSLALGDQCTMLIVRGKHRRHLGETDAALADHERAVELAQDPRLPADRRRHAEFELANTQVDRFELDQVIPWFTGVLAKAELSTERQVEIRGSFARVLALAGRFEDALRERRATIALHELDAKAAQTEPRSLVELAQLLARCGDAPAFDETMAQLTRSRRPGVEANQSVWNAIACLRGSAALRRYEAIAAWHDGGELFAGAPGFAGLVGDRDGTARAGYPANAIVRTTARALRKLGRCEEAIALGDSLTITGEGLISWLAWLVRAEGALALHALGREAEASTQLEEVRGRLRACHPAACLRHPALIDGDWAALDHEIDEVYY